MHEVVAQFFLVTLEIFLFRGIVSLTHAGDNAFEFHHPQADLLEFPQQWLDALSADREFLNQNHRLAAPQAQGPAQRQFLDGVLLLDIAGEVALVLVEQPFQSPQIVRHALQDLVFLKVFGQRHLDGAIERQFAQVHLAQGVDNLLHGAIHLKNLAAEATAGDLDFFGQGDLLLTLQKRNLAHLGQIHTHRVIDPTAIIIFEIGDFLTPGSLILHQAAVTLFGFAVIDQLDALLLQFHQKLVELVWAGILIGQGLVDLAIGQVALFLALIHEILECVLDLFHV